MKLNRRYLTLIACCLIHLIIGSVYADSVLYDVITQSTGWGRSWLVAGFSITILALGCSAAFYRRCFQGKNCESLLVQVAGIYIITMGLIWLTITSDKSLESLEEPFRLVGYMAVCISRGGCIGVLYAMTVGTVTELFTQRRGLCSGLVVMSFGLGSLIATKLYTLFLQYPIQNMILLQIGYWAVLLIAALVYQKEGVITYTSFSTVIQESMWKRLSIIFFLNICVGITLLSNLVALTLEQGLEYTDALWLVGAAGIANGLGRIIYSTLSDTFGRLEVLRLALLVQTFCLIILPWCWEVAILGIISVYGGGFALMPSICAEQLSDGTNGYSALLIWWGIAGLVGPLAYLAMPYLQLLVITSGVACICATNALHYSQNSIK